MASRRSVDGLELEVATGCEGKNVNVELGALEPPEGADGLPLNEWTGVRKRRDQGRGIPACVLDAQQVVVKAQLKNDYEGDDASGQHGVTIPQSSSARL